MTEEERKAAYWAKKNERKQNVGDQMPEGSIEEILGQLAARDSARRHYVNQYGRSKRHK